jgi:hypothetical protein
MSKTTDKVIALQQAEEQTAKTNQRTKVKLKTVNIKGKPYVTVDERLIYFRDHYPNYSLVSEVIEKTEDSILIKAIISDEKNRIIATGLAEEEKGSNYINKTSYVENCETSAWGRALANFGIGIDSGSVASAEEVINAISNQNKKPNIKFKKGTLTDVQFARAIESIKEGSYTKEQLLKTFKLTKLQSNTLISC